MKVLVVDDVDYIRKSISKVLSDNNFKCVTCENGRTAMEQLEQNDFDLIITDIVMPDVDGFEFIENVRNMSGNKSRILILAISGGSKTIDSEMALKTISGMADGLLQKPFAKADLLNTIAKVVGNKRR